MKLLGFKEIFCVDITRLAHEELIKDVISKFNRNSEKLPFKTDALINLRNADVFEALEKQLNIKYSAPADARNVGLENNSVDLISSGSTFEHIAHADIPLILNECYRILKPGGVFSMNINYRDHWAEFDKSISVYNFLKYSDAGWKKYNPARHYQNRLRHRDYVEMVGKTGFKIVEQRKQLPTEHELKELQRLKIHTVFASNYNIEELAVQGSVIVLRKE